MGAQGSEVAAWGQSAAWASGDLRSSSVCPLPSQSQPAGGGLIILQSQLTALSLRVRLKCNAQ